MMTKTLNLIKIIDSTSTISSDINDLIELAKANKVLLGLLRRANYNNSLRLKEENLYKNYMNEVAKISKVLNGLNYAFFKFRKPIEHISVDVDVLIHLNHLPKAIKNLTKLGFEIAVFEPYTVTMIKNGTIVDLYTHPSFAWIVYLNGERLLEEVDEIEGAKALSLEAEVVVTAAHALYKEHIYLLLDYYTIKRWINKRAFKLADELNVKEALELAININKQIEQGLTETPLKLNPVKILLLILSKFEKDSDFRSTMPNLIKLFSRKRSMKLLIWRFLRKTY